MKKILLSSFVAMAILTGCGEEKKEQTATVEATKPAEEKMMDSVKEATTTAVSTVKEETQNMLEAGSQAVKDASEKVAEVSEDVKTEVSTKVEEAQDKIEQSLDAVVETKKTQANSDTIDGKALYLKCAACHGTNGEKVALGKSQIIKGWTEQQVKDSLVGYQKGTYGGPMKGVMKSQVANLSPEEIDALSKYIASF